MLAAPRDARVQSQLLERVSDARRRSDTSSASCVLIRCTNGRFQNAIASSSTSVILKRLTGICCTRTSLGLKSFHPEFDRLFAFGIDPVGGGLPSDQPSDWPSLEAVHDYVRRIRAALDDKLADGSLESIRSDARRFSARHVTQRRD